MNDRKKDQISNEEWLATLKSTLDDGEAQVDSEVRRRLQQARREAIGVVEKRQTNPSQTTRSQAMQSQTMRWLLPAGGFAMLFLAAVLGYVIGLGPAGDSSLPGKSSVAAVEDLPMLTSPESLELYEELDFYQWLEEEQDSVG
jgi:hypothetical protein